MYYIPYSRYEWLRSKWIVLNVWGDETWENVDEEIKQAEKLNPDWKYRIARNHLNYILGYNNDNL